MEKKDKKKAYDILAGEGFRPDSASNELRSPKDIDKSELRITRIIYSFLTSLRNSSSTEEKEEVHIRLQNSIGKANRKKKIISRWAVAASFLLITLSVWFTTQNIRNKSDFRELVETLQISEPDSATQLILQDGSQVLIAEEESKIVYDQKGENIVIDSIKNITQNVEEKKPAFNTLVVPYGKRTQITLADGSKVWLNSGTKLVYPATITAGKREVYVDGEAIFDVTHMDGKPFYVKTKDFEIKVLGTVFNVSAYREDENTSAVLAEGRIEITSNKNTLLRSEKKTISPGTRIVFDKQNETFQTYQVNTNNFLSWRDGYLILEKEQLKNILKKISRYYNVEIDLQNPQIGEETFSGNLNLRKTPEEVLDIIAETTSINITKENSKLIINLN